MTKDTRPAKGSRRGRSTSKRAADERRELPARDLPCAWCGLGNSVYADLLAPWADKCWNCYDEPARRNVRDQRLQRASNKFNAKHGNSAAAQETLALRAEIDRGAQAVSGDARPSGRGRGAQAAARRAGRPCRACPIVVNLHVSS